MRQKEFKKQMSILQRSLHNGPDSQYAEQLQQIKQVYSKHIQQLITKLNDVGEEQKNVVLKQIKDADKLYLETQSLEIKGHVLFTRHGKCSSWAQKRYGLSPNTSISEEAEKSMARTNQRTRALLFYAESNPPFIALSPMNRAIQTGGLLIPQEIKHAEIVIDPALAENSDAPSGLDIRSRADMKKLYAETSFWKNPLKKILFLVSMWFYSDKDFQILYEKRQQAAAHINQHGSNINTSKDQAGHPDVRQDLNYQGDKIKDTKKLIEHAESRDCWLFGHGKNFKAFFGKELGITSSFAYGETRSVYKITTNADKPSLFSPPYSLVINQKTGQIEGKYTGILGVSVNQPLTSPGKKKPTHSVSTIMANLDAPIPQSRAQAKRKAEPKEKMAESEQKTAHNPQAPEPEKHSTISFRH